ADDASTGGEQVREVRCRRLAQGDEIRRLTPGSRFFGAARGDHLTDHGRQHGGSVVPADQVEAVERLIDEVERVSGIGEGAIRLTRKQEIGELGWPSSARERRQHGALGRFPVAYGRPTPQPAADGGKIGPARERRTLLARRLSIAVSRYAARAV